MKVEWIDSPPAPELARELEAFERAFEYPLGDALRFRIDHGADYSLFYRALSETAGGSLVATLHGRVVGVLSIAPRELIDPEGRRIDALYAGDLKVWPNVAGGLALRRLVQGARERFGDACDRAFAVVMDGTRRTPDRYTGRLGLPRFEKLGEVIVLRLDCDVAVPGSPSRPTRGGAAGSTGTYSVVRGRSDLRSTNPIETLATAGARGFLEDTRRAKRLFIVGGEEIRAAHLTDFRFESPHAGARLLSEARARCLELGARFLFTTVPRPSAAAIVEELGTGGVVRAPATVFGFGLEASHDWIIHSAEI